MSNDIRKSDPNLGSGEVSFMEDSVKKKTPRKWKGPKDRRRDPGAGTYPNQAWVMNTRSGHNIVIDDSEGLESMTFQHRGGSALQFQPNGAIQIVAHNSMYNLVFGQNRLTITGAHDVTVKGDGSMMIYGDYNKTVHGNFNITATGDMNLTAENLNRHIRGNIDTQAKNETKKLEGSSALAAQGAVAMVSSDSFTAVSRNDQMHLGGGSGLNMFVNEGNITGNIEKQGNFHFQAKDGTFEAKIKDAIKFLSESGAMHMIAQEAATILSKQGNIQINAQQGNIKVKADSGDLENEAGGSAALRGAGGTHVESSTGPIHISATAGNINTQGLAHYAQSGTTVPFNPLASLTPEEATSSSGQARPAKPTQAVASGDLDSVSKLA